eukprot:gene641-1236_t
MTATAYPRRKTYNASARFEKSKEIARKRKEQIVLERYRGSKIKKQFSKLCSKEGIQSSRVHIGKPNTPPDGSEIKPQSKTTIKKPNPFEKEIQISGQRKVEKIEKVKGDEKVKAEIKISKENREKRKSLFLKKTARGQPIMNNRVMDLLNKIKQTK